MRHNVIRRRIVGVAAAGAVTMLIGGCTPPGLASLPLPAPSLGPDAYTISATFANALNLPAKAKVRLGGADVGEVESMTAQDYSAVVTLRIRRGVRLPLGSRAELRTATPLGDVFVAMKTPPNPGRAMLKDGDSIGLESTASAATTEQVLSSAAIIVNGGAVRNLTKIINGFGKATGDDGAGLHAIVDQSNQLLGTLGKRSAQIQSTLDGASKLAAALNSRQQSIDDLLSSAGPALGAVDTNQLTGLVDQIGVITQQLGKMPSIRGTDTRGTFADLNTISRAFNDMVVSPDTSLLAVNRFLPILIKETSGTSISADITVAKLALGNMPDIGYQGDPAFHGPKQADWEYLVGSLKYSLYRLQERVVGQKP